MYIIIIAEVIYYISNYSFDLVYIFIFIFLLYILGNLFKREQYLHLLFYI